MLIKRIIRHLWSLQLRFPRLPEAFPWTTKSPLWLYGPECRRSCFPASYPHKKLLVFGGVKLQPFPFIDVFLYAVLSFLWREVAVLRPHLKQTNYFSSWKGVSSLSNSLNSLKHGEVAVTHQYHCDIQIIMDYYPRSSANCPHADTYSPLACFSTNMGFHVSMTNKHRCGFCSWHPDAQSILGHTPKPPEGLPPIFQEWWVRKEKNNSWLPLTAGNQQPESYSIQNRGTDRHCQTPLCLPGC